jgi:hypothetical protein
VIVACYLKWYAFQNMTKKPSAELREYLSSQGLKGGSCAQQMTAEERKELARKAARARRQKGSAEELLARPTNKKQERRQTYCIHHKDEMVVMRPVTEGYLCPKCGHREFIRAYEGLGKRLSQANVCRCENCLKKRQVSSA